MTAFLGVDLAWSDRNPTGAVALVEADGALRVAEIAPPLRGLGEVHAFIERHSAADMVIAIDAPLIITNWSGQRRCERELSRRFGRHHASCHSSNLSRSPDAAGVRLARWLASLDFVHAIVDAPRTMLEVYPHAAYVSLFELASIIRYKKGSALEKSAGLRIAQDKLARLPIHRSAALDDLLERDPTTLRGTTRKSFEDSLDALLCAYLAFHFRRHGADEWTIFGDRRDGYIANPHVALVEGQARSVVQRR